MLALTVLATLLHAAFVLTAAPLIAGLAATLRARLLGRRGPAPTQPYRDLAKLLRKRPAVPDNATDLFTIWPFAAFAATATAALLVPSFCFGMATAPLADLITFLGLLAGARAATLLATLETGSGLAGAGAARALVSAVLAQAPLLLVVLTLALATHNPNIDGIGRNLQLTRLGLSVSLAFTLAATLAIAFTQTSLGLTSEDQPTLLEYSGRHLALFHYTAMLRLIVWFCWIAAVFFPFGMGDADAILTWLAGLLLWTIKLIILVAAFAGAQAIILAPRIPQLLGLATLLAVLGAAFWFAQRLGA